MPPTLSTAIPALVRRTDRDRPLADLLQEAAARGPITLRGGPDGALEDEAAVDPLLATQQGKDEPPTPGTPYAGLTPKQRHRFLEWARQADAPAPPAFRRLYIANLEARLLERARHRDAHWQLRSLAMHPIWQNDEWLGRAILFGYWIEQDGEKLAEWLEQGRLSPALLGIALGMQARLATPFTPGELGAVLTAWKLASAIPEPDLLKLRLASLTSALGAEPLTYALAQTGDAATTPVPWRCAHRGLRVALPQPDLRPALEGPLADMLVVADIDHAPVQSSEGDDISGTPGDSRWQLILEFGHSRSEFFEPILVRCRRLPGFTQLMDEDRKLVYRVVFARSELRRFWQIWDYVQGWSTARVYLNGEELEKWKVWPYSQYLR